VTELRFDDPCLIFALGRESKFFRREFKPNQAFPGAPCRARFCGPAWLPVLVVETGVGREATCRALDWLAGPPALDKVAYRPKLVLSAGFCGGLTPSLKVGDVVLATEVVDVFGNSTPLTWPGPLPPGRWEPPLHRGRVITINHLVADPAEKRQLAENFQAIAVDMEAAEVARWCGERGIPCGCVRAMSDDVNAALSPVLVSLLAGSGASAWRVLAALARRPTLARELWRLARDTKMAARQLGVALGELLTLTLPEELR
jgi:adenosylhomocysteine nucleosidase